MRAAAKLGLLRDAAARPRSALVVGCTRRPRLRPGSAGAWRDSVENPPRSVGPTFPGVPEAHSSHVRPLTGFAGGVSGDARSRVSGRGSGQYHLPFAKPPKAIRPTNAMISPIQKLQTIIRTIPTITRMPPSPMPPVLPPERASAMQVLLDEAP